jgi:(p)ppGpp synthase/HD superfamily hydrolase
MTTAPADWNDLAGVVNRLKEERWMEHNLSADARVHLVRKAHEGQKDKCGFDYFETHLLPVARSVPANLYYAALAHDILEDTSTTEDALRDAGFSSYEIELIKLLTKPAEVDQEYIEYLRLIAINADAKIIKVMDIASNLSRMHNIKDKETSTRLVGKYLEALTHLMR